MFLTCGCGRLMYFFWPFGRTQTFEAEFDGLESHSVAVVIFAGDQTQYEYPWATLNLSAMISSQLKNRVKDLTIVDPKKITAYQRKNLHWMSMDKTDLGKKLKTNFILHISLIEFSTAEKGTVDTLRGVINGEIKLYDCSKPEDDSCVWTCENIRLQFPKIPTIRTPKNERAIRESIIEKFSTKLTKKFYTYTVDKEDLEKLEDQ
jgi:hypothetical protein